MIYSLFGSLFKKKDAVKPKPDFYSIVCPFCMSKFEPEEVMFRASHDKDNDEYYGLQEDLKLNKWKRKFHMSEEGDKEAVLNPASFTTENRIYSGKVLVGLNDAYGEITKRRLCPDCHNELPVNAGLVPSNIISLVGASEAGKTVYMTSLIHTLQNSTAGNFNAACIPLNADVNRRFRQDYQEPLFETGDMLAATNPNVKPEPLIFQFVFKDENLTPLTLVFFDVAGEGMSRREYLELFGPHIKNSAGILFLVDPLQIKVIRDKIKLHLNMDDGDISSVSASPVDVVSSLFENFIAHQQQGKTSIPTAVVLTKSDMLQHLKDEQDEYIPSNSNVFRNVVHRGFLNSHEFENINGEIGRFLEKVDRPFKGAIDVYFADAAYFAVSALGSNPVRGQIESVINPIRVDEPFIWLLHKLGYIERRDG
jgi:hypothetical protein